MRLLWISHTSRVGGAELSLAEGARALTERGHDVAVVLPSDGCLRSRLEPAVSVYVIPHNPWTTAGGDGPRTLARWSAYNLLRAAPALERLMRRLRAEVVISNTIGCVTGALAAQRAGIPHVWFLREYGREDHGLRFIVGEPIAHHLMKRWTDRFMVPSEALRCHFTPAFGRGSIHVVYPAVEVPDIDSGRPPANEGRPLQLILCGLKTESKGQHDAVRAVAALVASGRTIELTLVGPAAPGYEEFLREEVNRLGVQGCVRSVGFTPQVAALLGESDVALMCSRAEALGRVTIEAMKAGKPVIGTSRGGSPELIRHNETGLLYPPGDVVALTTAIASLDDDRGRLEQMGQHARLWASSRFTMSGYADGLEDALSGLSNRRVSVRRGRRQE